MIYQSAIGAITIIPISDELITFKMEFFLYLPFLTLNRLNRIKNTENFLFTNRLKHFFIFFQFFNF